MGEKIARTQIKVDESLQYYVKGGDIWAKPRSQHGQPKGKSHKVTSVGVLMEDGYLYYVESDGDVARTNLGEQLDIIRLAVGRSDALAAAASHGFEYAISRDASRSQLDRVRHLIDATVQATATAVDIVDSFCAMMAERVSLNSDSYQSASDIIDPQSDA